jgi:DNA-binding response OmpR family regulator
MPGMNGFELISAIREVDPVIPLLVITGFASQENIQKCFSLGANDYFSKPFDINRIVTRADEILREKTESDPTA